MASAAVSVIDRPEQAAILLKPEHRRLLGLLAVPDSAAGLARRSGSSRQIVNYHLREMEEAGLIVLDAERRKGNCMERVMKRAANSFVISSEVMGDLGSDPDAMPDKLSAQYLVAVAARTIKEISRLSRKAESAGKILPTLTLDTQVRFRSAQERNAFTLELAAAVGALVQKYHDETAPGGRRFRLTTGVYPHIPETGASYESNASA
jgi:DNA-binding transcriptional ArsR family regulator